MFNTRNFTGVDGELKIATQDAMPAEVLEKYLGTGHVIGRVVNVSVSLITEIKAFHELGSRLPKELRAGNISISGTVERAYINGALLRLMLGQYAAAEEPAVSDRTATEPGEHFNIPVFDMSVTLENSFYGDGTGNAVLTVFGVMFDSWQFDLPEDDFVLERLSFKAKRIKLEDEVEIPA